MIQRLNTIQMFFKVALIVSVLVFQACHHRNNADRKRHEVRGKVVTIIDGDTYDLLVNGNHLIRIRMEGIDSPERGMPFYKVSKNYLSRLCANKTVSVKITGKDIYGRLLGYSYLDDGAELSHEMIKAGLAWHLKKYNNDPVLANLEINARNMRKGLWFDERPMAPWTNRELHRKGISTKDSFNFKGRMLR